MVDYKNVRCNRCRCQDICKIENDFRTTQKKLNDIMNGGDSFFSLPDLICSHFIPIEKANIRNSEAERSNSYFNEKITAQNTNQMVEDF